MKIHFQTPQDIRQQIWKELGRASQDRHHAWRTPVLATTGSDGTVNARTVVLREVDAPHQTFRIYTDWRSLKFSELIHEPNALFVFWSARLNWQLRVRVSVTTHTTGPQVDDLWERVRQSAAATDYLGPAAPGSPRPDPHSDSTVDQATHHFALLIAQVQEMDWLELSRDGHRRARLLADDWQWLTP
jgi:pyridoxamine 5'-phosphate oxidase